MSQKRLSQIPDIMHLVYSFWNNSHALGLMLNKCCRRHYLWRQNYRYNYYPCSLQSASSSSLKARTCPVSDVHNLWSSHKTSIAATVLVADWPTLIRIAGDIHSLHIAIFWSTGATYLVTNQLLRHLRIH